MGKFRDCQTMLLSSCALVGVLDCHSVSQWHHQHDKCRRRRRRRRLRQKEAQVMASFCCSFKPSRTVEFSANRYLRQSSWNFRMRQMKRNELGRISAKRARGRASVWLHYLVAAANARVGALSRAESDHSIGSDEGSLEEDRRRGDWARRIANLR